MRYILIIAITIVCQTVLTAGAESAGTVGSVGQQPALYQDSVNPETQGGRVEFPSTIKVAVRVINSAGKPVEGVAVYYTDEYHLSGYTRQAPVTNAEGIVWFDIPFNSKGQFEVSHLLNESISGGKEYFKESTPYQINGAEDAGKQFTFVLSDKMIEMLFK